MNEHICMYMSLYYIHNIQRLGPEAAEDPKVVVPLPEAAEVPGHII